MGGKEDKFDRFDEMAQLPGGYDVSLAREKALEHARNSLPQKENRLQGLSLNWEIKSAKFDEDEDCYRVVVLGYPANIDFESKAECEYHIDAKGNLYPGTPVLVAKGKWAIEQTKQTELEQQEEARKKAEEEKQQKKLEETRKRDQEEATNRKTEEEKGHREERERKEREEAIRKRAEEKRRRVEEEHRRKEVVISSSTGLFSTHEMIPIPNGTFLMGDQSGYGDEDEYPVVNVSISPFYMAAYQVTFNQWEEVMDWAQKNGYKFINQGGRNVGEVSVDGNHPITKISWYDAVLWCNALSEMEGKFPCYFTSFHKVNVYRSDKINIRNDLVDWKANGYRLPTEAEWEYACRAGTSTRYSYGDSIDSSDANYGFNNNGTTPVGSYSANLWGLYDMHGNVWEWCWNWYSPYISSSDNDPKGSSSGSIRVLRGGSWNSSAESLRSANRGYNSPYRNDSNISFRMVCSQ